MDGSNGAARAAGFRNWLDGARSAKRASRTTWWRRASKAQFPGDFPVPHGARPVPSDAAESGGSVADGEVCARWDLDGEHEGLQSMLTFALRRRGYAVAMTTPPDTFHEGATLAVSRGDLLGAVSWSRLGTRGEGPLRLIATFESR
jgi:hypothetical protein